MLQRGISIDQSPGQELANPLHKQVGPTHDLVEGCLPQQLLTVVGIAGQRTVSVPKVVEDLFIQSYGVSYSGPRDTRAARPEAHLRIVSL